MARNSMRYLNMRFNLPFRLTHMILYGQTGTGKSQTLKSCVERAFLRGNTKILDLYSGGSEEGAYYALKSSHLFWKDREYKYNNKKTKAMEFPVNCLVPFSKNLPGNIPDIYTPFTIPLNTITENDLKSMLGGDLTKSEIALWRRVHEKINRSTTLIDLLNYMIDTKTSEKKDERIPGVSAHGISSVYNMFSAFEKQFLFSSANHPLALNIEHELNNRKVITSLILKYFPEQYWGFIINYFIHTTYDLVLQGKIKHNVIIVLREAGDFLEGMTDSPQEEAVKRSIINILRKGRKHRLFFWIDNQTPMNMDIIKTQFPVKICHFVDNTEELKSSLGDLGSMLLNREDYTALMGFKPGKCYVLTPSGLFAPQMLPPLSRMSGEEGNDFFSIWRSEKGSRFRPIAKELEDLKQEYKESEQKWKEILERRKVKKKSEKEKEKLEKKRIRDEQNEKKLAEKALQAEEIKAEKQKTILNNPPLEDNPDKNLPGAIDLSDIIDLA